MKAVALILLVQCSSIVCLAQKLTGNLSFQQGQNLVVTVNIKTTVTQQAMGNVIDFTVDGMARHAFKVTNTTDDNSTLHHDVRRVTFSLEGMGPKRSFDSENKKDMDGIFGPAVKEMLGKSFDMILDPSGKVLMVKPEKVELAKPDDRLTIVFNMLKELTNVVYPPKKNDPSFFKILPDTATGLNGSWTENSLTAEGRFSTTYTLSAITDSTATIDFKGTSTTNTQAEVMGRQISTNMKNTYSGTILLDKTTGIIRKKSMTVSSTGTTEGMGGTTPVTSKTEISTTVASEAGQ
jgi:hypothetical protein